MSAPAYDLVVLGGGTAGILAAKTAASFGASVVLVEREAEPGGDCLWTGCVPSKTLLAVARQVADARAAETWGLRHGGPVDFGRVMARVRAVVEQIAPVDSAAALGDAGVEVLTGLGRFTGPDELSAAGRELRFAQAVVATGSEPVTVPALAGAEPLTTATVWSLEDLPDRLLVVGGGSSGCELAQAFARLGATVTLVEAQAELLPREDPHAAAVVRAALLADGIDVRTGRQVREASPGRAVLDDGSVLAHDRLLAVTGRRPRTRGLGLAEARVELDGEGYVVTDRHLATTNPRIWAAGDVTGPPMLTHVAGVHGSLVASNAVLGLRRATASTPYPRVTFTHPELAAVGVPAEQAGHHDGLRVVTLAHRHLDRAIAEDEEAGLTRLVLDRRGRLRGAVVVGPRAGETIGEAALAVQQGVRVSDLVATTHPYPTFSDGLWNLAVSEYLAGLGRGVSGLAVRGLGRWRQRRLRRPRRLHRLRRLG